MFLHLIQGEANAPLSEAPHSINLETSANIMLASYLLLKTNVTSVSLSQNGVAFNRHKDISVKAYWSLRSSESEFAWIMSNFQAKNHFYVGFRMVWTFL